MKRCSAFPKTQALLEPHYQIVYVMSRTLVEGWGLLLCRGVVGIFYSSSRLGSSLFSNVIMQPTLSTNFNYQSVTILIIIIIIMINMFTYNMKHPNCTDMRRNTLLIYMQRATSERTKRMLQEHKKNRRPTIYIDQHILNEVKTDPKNVALVWIDHKKV